MDGTVSRNPNELSANELYDLNDMKSKELYELKLLIEQFLEKKKQSQDANYGKPDGANHVGSLTSATSSAAPSSPPERIEFDSSTLSGPNPGDGLRSRPPTGNMWQNVSPSSVSSFNQTGGVHADCVYAPEEILRKHFLDHGRSHSGSSINSVEHPSQCWPSPVGTTSSAASIQMAATAAGAAPSVVDQFASTQGAAFVRCGSSVSSRGSPSQTSAHSPSMERALENHMCEDISSTQRNQLFKTELCRTYMETNRCRYGSKCQFAHGHSELRPVKRHPKYKTKVCRNFADTGSCPYGSRCRFIHGPNAPAAEVDEELLNAVNGVRIGYLGDESEDEVLGNLPILQLLQGNQEVNLRSQKSSVMNPFSRAPGTVCALDSGW